MLSRLRNLVFNIRRRTRSDRFVGMVRRMNRLARLMTVMQRKPRRTEGDGSRAGRDIAPRESRGGWEAKK